MGTIVIERFRKLYGEDVYRSIKRYLIENDLLKKFKKVVTNKDKLFRFAFDYGLYEVVRFLYEEEGISYDLKMITDYKPAFGSQSDNGSQVSVAAGGYHNGLNVAIWDKYTITRSRCIQYLMQMKKYSRYTYQDGNFIYRFNPKYKNIC